jgi:hypothetical protein
MDFFGKVWFFVVNSGQTPLIFILSLVINEKVVVTKDLGNLRIHQTDKNSHVYEHHNIPGHEIDFENVEILDRADTTRKLEYKEMLYTRKLKPTINKQTEGELFTLIIRNIKLEYLMERDIQKYLKKPTNKNYKK